MIKEEAGQSTSSTRTNGHQNQPDNKERTLFCINIDQKCSEDILYELFLQAGPIENIIRKEDRNGHLICLIVYKHAQSCDYAIKIFNGITLFNQSLKVQLSQGPGAAGANQNKRVQPPQNNYANNNGNHHHRANRQVSNENHVTSPLSSIMAPPQQNMLMQIAQQFGAVNANFCNEFGVANQYQNYMPNQQLNRSISGQALSFENEQQQHHQSRKGNHNSNQHHRGYSSNNNNNNRRSYNNNNNHYNEDRDDSRDFRKQSRDTRFKDRSRSRSPIRKRNKF